MVVPYYYYGKGYNKGLKVLMPFNKLLCYLLCEQDKDSFILGMFEMEYSIRTYNLPTNCTNRETSDKKLNHT
jgi:hypothetical protein